MFLGGLKDLNFLYTGGKTYRISFQVTEEGEEQQACPTLQQIEENVQNWGQAEPDLDAEQLEAEEGVGDNEDHTEGAENEVEGSAPVS